ncbi:ATPase associated with various cellular activities (AAA) family protein [Babesia bovis T2Bo]|uniref:ATPase AAA-type core domain-containing protein n=1 Tax=Babesia bovis TaxID=5865 RepID=A7APQ3_BABBO|nr:ATPase associated with various cellular activities (AAA) family protein [Babesia bovis T2Bo]EDO08537.1 ATPase associated with various cellular activities (AAA) family protein [Babesia bovis T2Bo]|eukprot:XP_001612105.1 hypothetical protein [Babesia bovis T2Bo]
MDNIEIYSSHRPSGLRLERIESPFYRDDHVSSELAVETECYAWRISDTQTSKKDIVTKSKGNPLVAKSVNIPILLDRLRESRYERLFTALSSRLQRAATLWRQSALQDICDDRYMTAGTNVINVCIDTVMARIIGICLGDRLTELPCGFWFSASDPFLINSFCKQLCRNAYWFSDNAFYKDRDRRIYTLDVSRGTGTPRRSVCYDLSGHVRCFCKICTDIVALLRRDAVLENDPFVSFSSLIYDILENHLIELLQFLDHNSNDANIEHQLLLISVDAYISRQKLCHTLSSWSKNPSSISTVVIDNFDNTDPETVADACLTDCGCFAVVTGLDSLINHDVAHRDVSTYSIVVDLLRDYSTMWSEYNLPVYLIYCHDVGNHLSSPVRDIFYDLSSSSYEGPTELYMLHRVSYFRYHVVLSHISECVDVWVKRILLSHLGWGTSDLEVSVLDNLVAMTSGYDRDSLETLIHIAACEYVSEFGHDNLSITFSDPVVTLRCFERAISAREPSRLSIGVPNISVIPYNTGHQFNGFAPLKQTDSGHIVTSSGFDSIVLCDTLKSRLDLMISGSQSHSLSPFICIEGPSGYGKTHLAICMSHEFKATLIHVNIPSFIRSEVSLSERLMNQFFSSLKMQFPFVSSQEGSTPPPPRCVVVLENCECLSESTLYIRSLLYALCTELSHFRDHWEWSFSRSVLFVFTCESFDRIPERIREICDFKEVIRLDQSVFGLGEIRRCFELYLGHRGSLLDRFTQLWPSWCQDIGVSSLRPCDIVLICRTAAMWSVSGISVLDTDSVKLSAMSSALCATVDP